MKCRKIGDIYDAGTSEAYYKTFGHEVDCNSEINRFFLELIPLSLKGKTAFDLGAGNGCYSELLHHRGADRVIAYDLSDSMIDQMNERKVRNQLERLDVVKGDMENIPFAEKEIDFIFSRFSVMYTCNLHSLIGKLGEIMTDSGEMLLIANFATIVDFEGVIKNNPVPLNLKIGENCVAIKNYPNTLNDYHSAISNAGFFIEATRQFPAGELSVDSEYPYANALDFNYVVFHLKKEL